MIWLSDEELTELGRVKGVIAWHENFQAHLRYLETLIQVPLSPKDFESEEWKKFSKEWDEAANAERPL